jgi:hypothetical protein
MLGSVEWDGSVKLKEKKWEAEDMEERWKGEGERGTVNRKRGSVFKICGCAQTTLKYLFK